MSNKTKRGTRTNRSAIISTTITEADRKKLKTAAYKCDTTVPEVLHLLIKAIDSQWIRETITALNRGR